MRKADAEVRAGDVYRWKCQQRTPVGRVRPVDAVAVARPSGLYVTVTFPNGWSGKDAQQKHRNCTADEVVSLLGHGCCLLCFPASLNKVLLLARRDLQATAWTDFGRTLPGMPIRYGCVALLSGCTAHSPAVHPGNQYGAFPSLLPPTIIPAASDCSRDFSKIFRQRRRGPHGPGPGRVGHSRRGGLGRNAGRALTAGRLTGDNRGGRDWVWVAVMPPEIQRCCGLGRRALMRCTLRTGGG